MKNIEKYYDELVKYGISFAVVGGKPVDCGDCDECELKQSNDGSCGVELIKWLNEEYVPHLEIDAQVLVSDDGEVWRKRHFARFENGYPVTWASGRTSWSVDNDHADVQTWNYWKSPEGEEEKDYKEVE